MTKYLSVPIAFLWVQMVQGPTPVSGVVTDSETKAPVADVRVLLARTDARLTDSIVVLTDARGRFEIRSAPPGAYRVFAEHDEYLRKEHEAPITIVAGASAGTIAIALTPTAVISGRVVNEFGDPAAKINVRALSTKAVVEARTNDLGEYRLFGLPPGSYVIRAERFTGPAIQGTTYVVPTPPGPDSMGEGQSMTMAATLLRTGGFIDPIALTGQTSVPDGPLNARARGRTYPPIYYPGTTEPGGAQPVAVTAGAQVSGIDFRLAAR